MLTRKENGMMWIEAWRLRKKKMDAEEEADGPQELEEEERL